MARRRLDAELVRRQLVASRETARRLILDNKVLVDGSFAAKPAHMVEAGQSVELVGDAPPYVSRAGQKLAGALDAFGLDPTGLLCLDAGSSTGGFTDCLLQSGARHVVAVDVGTNQLHEKIRTDDRVTAHERTDIRTLEPAMFDAAFDLIVGDLSFISLRLVLPGLRQLLAEDGRMVMLVKPQFEAGRVEVSKGKGIISDPAIWRRVILDVVDTATELGLATTAIEPSTLRGSGGNVEFVALLDPSRPTLCERESIIDDVVARVVV